MLDEKIHYSGLTYLGEKLIEFMKKNPSSETTQNFKTWIEGINDEELENSYLYSTQDTEFFIELFVDEIDITKFKDYI